MKDESERDPGVQTRDEHLARAKQRAVEYLNRGDMWGAVTSILSDLGGHPETANHAGLELGTMLMLGGFLKTEREVREFIEGFR